MSEEKKLSAEELDNVAGGIGGDVNIGRTGGDATVLDQSVTQKLDQSFTLINDHSKKIDDHSKKVDTDIKTDVSVG